MATTTKTVAFKVEVDTSQVGEGVQEATTSVENLGAATKKASTEMKTGFKAAEQGTKGLGTSIGGLIKALGVVGAAMAVFTFMKDVLSKNQKVMDAINTATTALEIIILKLFDALEPVAVAMKNAFENPKKAVIELWELIKENFVNRLEGVVLAVQSAGRTIEAAFSFDWEAAKKGAADFGSAMIQVATGLDAAQQEAFVQGVKDFANEIVNATIAAVAQADALTRLRNEVALLNAEQRGIQLTFQKEAEIQRQIRDDISRTIAERIEANDRLGEILEEQFESERRAADKRIALAQAELAMNSTNVDKQVELINAKTELADLDERITGQRSEQIVNQKALEKELFDLQQELRVATLTAREKELADLDIYYEQLAEKARLASDTSIDIEGAKLEAVTALNDKYRKIELAETIRVAREKAAAEQRIADARVRAATEVGNVLGAVGKLVENQGKAGLIASKTLAIAQIAINMATAISGAISSASKATTVWEMIAGIAAGVAAVVSGIGQATAIINTVNVGPSAAAPSVSSAMGSASASAPSFSPVTTNTTELGNTQQAELAPIQAFVVETAITGSQNNIGQIEGQASFGNPE